MPKQLLQLANIATALVEQEIGSRVAQAMGRDHRNPSRLTPRSQPTIESLVAQRRAIASRKDQLAARKGGRATAKPNPADALEED